MEYLKVVAETRASPKRGLFRFSKTRNHQNNSSKNGKSNMFEAIAKINGGSVVSQSKDDGTVRLKIVVRKQDLEQMLQVMQGHEPEKNTSVQKSTLCVEQRLNLLRKKQLLRANLAAKGSRRRGGPWRPALQSIPEDF